MKAGKQGLTTNSTIWQQSPLSHSGAAGIPDGPIRNRIPAPNALHSNGLFVFSGYGEGEGHSKKEAEQQAADAAWISISACGAQGGNGADRMRPANGEDRG